MGYVIGAIIILLILAIIGLYNSLVTLRQRVKNAWSQIDVQLQRRFDLIPNLVEAVKGYMQHESSVLEKVTALRTSWANATTVSEKAELDNQLSRGTENKISASRQFYNDSVTRYNTKLEVFPSNLIGGMFGFKPEELFKAESEEARRNVKVDFNK